MEANNASRPRLLILCALLSAAVAQPGCGEEGPRDTAPAVERRDSAGIRIVETTRPAWTDGRPWTLETEPSLEIGLIEGELPYLFGEVRGAVRLENGSIVVVDNQAREVRWFDDTGTFVRAVGGPGEGPAEFPESAWQLERCGAGRLYVHDRWGRRLLVWDSAGAFRRGFAFHEPGNPGRGPYGHVCRDDGGFVAVGWGADATVPSVPEGQDALAYDQYSPVWALDSLGVLQVGIGSFLSSERIRTRGGSSPHPFARQLRFAAGVGSVFLGTGEGLAVGVYSTDSLAAATSDTADSMPRPVALWRAHTDDLAFDDAFMQEYARAEINPLYVRERDWILEGVIALPPQLPAYDELRVSPDGHLWARRFTPPWQTGERWGVFAPDGVFLGDVAMPENFRVTDIGPDHVLGIATDSLDVERVHLYRINK